jgi:ketosteroid isomerase-like protein
MSQENVEIVWKTLGRLNNGEPVADVLLPDVVFEVHAGPEPGVYRGVRGVIEYYRRYFGAWEDFRVVIDEVLEAPEEKVFASVRDTGRGKRSGAPVEMSIFQVWSFRDRKVARWQGFASREQALKAAGLSEQDAHADS